jgi:hypothetical protein
MLGCKSRDKRSGPHTFRSLFGVLNVSIWYLAILMSHFFVKCIRCSSIILRISQSACVDPVQTEWGAGNFVYLLQQTKSISTGVEYVSLNKH